MDVMNQVLVLFLLILCGFTAVKAGWIREGGIQGLNAMVLYFSLPCLTVAKLQQEASPGLMLELSLVRRISPRGAAPARGIDQHGDVFQRRLHGLSRAERRPGRG